MSFYEFASGSPFLTFFLAMILGDVIIKVVSSICGIPTKWNERAIMKKDKK